MELILKISGLVILSAVFITILRRYLPEQSLILSLAAVFAVFAIAGKSIQSAIGMTEKLASLAHIAPNQLTPLLKVLGITVLTKFTTDFCKDAGSSGLAGMIELVGNVMAIIASLPLLDSMIQLVTSL